jgi:hypothetical protein
MLELVFMVLFWIRKVYDFIAQIDGGARISQRQSLALFMQLFMRFVHGGR